MLSKNSFERIRIPAQQHVIHWTIMELYCMVQNKVALRVFRVVIKQNGHYVDGTKLYDSRPLEQQEHHLSRSNLFYAFLRLGAGMEIMMASAVLFVVCALAITL